MNRHLQVNSNRRSVGVGIKIGTIACAASVTLSASLPLAAHHSFAAEFDVTREVKATGEVSEVDWRNPHAWVHLRVHEVCERRATPGGGNGDNEIWTCRTPSTNEANEWTFELASPNGLMRQGWTRNSLNPGDQLTIEGWRARDNSPNGNARIVMTDDGKRLFAGSSQSSTP